MRERSKVAWSERSAILQILDKQEDIETCIDVSETNKR
jgi:hypothetical protein